MTTAEDMKRHLSSAVHHRPAEILIGTKKACEPIIRNAVSTLPEPLRLMAGYHFGWWDATGTSTTGESGKALRPALTMASAVSLEGSMPAASVYAAAVELAHNFTLIHDDIMDADRVRHGRPAIWQVWGRTDAMLLGNALHALALRVISDHTLEVDARIDVTQAVNRLETAVIEMCRGQHKDCIFDIQRDVSIDEYIGMAMGKTGALMGCACALGAVAAGADPSVVSTMDQFGRKLGLAFQCADDLLGIWGDPQITGKPANDLMRHKLTLPVLAAMASDNAAALELKELYRPATNLTPELVRHIADLIDAAGGRLWTERCADHCVRDAITALPRPLPDLVAVAHILTRRER